MSERLLLFYAQSGAGKSSLLNTRIIPRLRDEEGFQVLPVGRVSGELPAGLAQVDNIDACNLMASLDQSAAHPARLAKATLNDFLARLARAAAGDSQGQHTSRWVYRPKVAVQRPDPRERPKRPAPAWRERWPQPRQPTLPRCAPWLIWRTSCRPASASASR